MDIVETQPQFVHIDTPVYEVSSIDADQDGICESQKPASGGSLTLNGALVSGGVATLSPARPVSVTSDADDMDRVFVIIGNSAGGSSLREYVKPGPNNHTVETINYFASVSDVQVDAGTRGNIEVGSGVLPEYNTDLP